MMLFVVLCILTCSSDAGFILGKSSLVFSNKCIGDLGCFYTGSPFYHPVWRPVSLSPTSKVDRIHFRLFTRPDLEYDLDPDPSSIRGSGFDPGAGTKVIIHGFTVKLKPGHVMYRMKDAILANGDYNVIIVDWTQINDHPYAQAAANTRVVGAKLAKLIQALMNETGVTAESFHIIGHSLGAHTAGYAGQRIENLGRITGLDPAGPYYRKAGPEVRLDPTDAQFVDIVHTDGAAFVASGFGIEEAIGHMDFYPNGGNIQPGCAYTSERDDFIGTAINATAEYKKNGCDHSRAVDYFVESVNDTACKFLAVSCDKYKNYERGFCQPDDGRHAVAEMGFHAELATGIDTPARYYLRTHEDSPFCDEDSIRIDPPDEDAKPQISDYDEAEPQTLDPDEAESQIIYLDEAESQTAYPDETEPQAADSDEAESQTLDPDEQEPTDAEPQAIDADEQEPTEAEPQAIEADEQESTDAEPQAIDADEQEPTEAEPQAIDADEQEPTEAEPQAIDADKQESTDAEPQ